jgi:hypothetical protein
MTLSHPHSDALYVPNRMGRFLLNAYEEVIGPHGVTALSKLSGVQSLLNETILNTDDEFCADDLGKIHETLERMFGPRAGRGLALRAGRVFFKYGLKEYGPSIGFADLDFRLLPLSNKIERGSHTIVDLVNAYAGETIDLKQTNSNLILHIDRCPLCWERSTDEPEALYWLSGGKNYLVEETACIASGDQQCVIQIARTPLD